jgi:hypothetical protein
VGTVIDAYFNYKDSEGNPAGGFVSGVGLRIDWQDGPLGRGGDRVAPNGAFVETVIRACIKRLEYFQDSKFKCYENEVALVNLKEALRLLNDRTKRREEQGVEGTHQV